MDILKLIRKQAERRPEQIAIRDEDSGICLSYAQLVEQSAELARWLQRRGCRVGQRCGLLMEEGTAFLVSALGILESGLCLVPIGVLVPNQERNRVVEAARLHWLLRANKDLVRMPQPGPIDNQRDREFSNCQPAYIRFTSGSTGARKGVLLGHPTIVERIQAANEVLAIDHRDRIWFALPMSDHLVVSVFLYLSTGATVMPCRNAACGERFIRETLPTVSYGAPDFYLGLIRSPISALDSLRLVISTTSPLQKQIASGFEDKFGRMINAALGIIEVGLLTINLDSRETVGKPMPAYDLTLLDKEQLVPQGEVGEIYVRGPGLLDAYVAPWRPRRTLLGPYGLATGDFARFDVRGNLILIGRGKNRVLIGGQPTFYEEIEDALNSLPGIEESRAYLDPGSKQLAAELVGKPISPSEILHQLAERIETRKLPQIFRFVESLARTANGKLLRADSIENLLKTNDSEE
ncbi:MAG: acyl--CoA ligase [Verrucomicrobia bacterium]|nr:acyl--CoA ligase [Verrucomicrobiota bacterium]